MLSFKSVFMLWLSVWLGVLLSACDQPTTPDTLDLNAALGGVADQGFARAIEPHTFKFPAEHAAHPAFRNEWWYVTGNVQAADGRAFGYQVTFFRTALTPKPPRSPSAWVTHQVWMAHVALTDVQAQTHQHEQRFARGAAGLAGQADVPFKVWLEDWQIVGSNAGEFPWSVTVKTADFSLNLLLTPEKNPVLQGENGLSQKSSAPGNASYYYSFTRLKTEGEIRQGTARYTVSGQSWLDREWSTSALADDQAGWDWFSLQLNDGRDLMFYRLRLKNGQTDVHSAGKWVSPDGQAETLGAQAVKLKPLRYWQAASGARYPIAWELELPNPQHPLTIEALVEDQLMQTGIITYWEGAVRILDTDSQAELGRGYLEMSGYE